MFQGADGSGSRFMKPLEENQATFLEAQKKLFLPSKPNRMASNIFGPTEEPQNVPKRTNPPELFLINGRQRRLFNWKKYTVQHFESSRKRGKGSGIFDESTPVQTRQRLNPPGGKTSDIFGSPVTATAPLAHPNKPKDHILLCEGEDSKSVSKAATSSVPGEELSEKDSPRVNHAKMPEPTPTVDSHEPRLGPRPRSHNKVLNPPGGKSSISFY